jgi:hypothetical protein
MPWRPPIAETTAVKRGTCSPSSSFGVTDFTFHLPELAGTVDLIVLRSGEQADDDVIWCLTRAHRVLRPPQDSQLARAVISVLHETTLEESLATVKQEQHSTEPPGGEAPSNADKILRHWDSIHVHKTTAWSRDIMTSSLKMKTTKDPGVGDQEDQRGSLRERYLKNL